MSSTFPDTSITNPATGFNWTSGDTWSDPNSGLTYVWEPPVWKANNSNGVDSFVQIVGDNMTGDLTLGTDKITLDAGGGSITAGKVSAGVVVGDTALVAINNDDSATYPTILARNVGTGYLFDGRDAAGTTVVHFGVNGSGDFTSNISSTNGYVAAGQNPSGGALNGTRMYGGGGVYAATANASADLWRGYTVVAGTGSTPTSTIGADGTATFVGNVVSGSAPDASSSTTNGSSLNAGSIYNQLPSGAASTVEAYGQYYGTNSVISFKADGTASFKGTLYSEKWFESNRTDAAETAFYAKVGGVEKVNIESGGRCRLGGTDANPGLQLNALGTSARQGAIDAYGFASDYGSSTAALFRVRSDEGGGGTVQYLLKANGDGYFRGTLTVNGSRPLIINLEPDNASNYVSTMVDGEQTSVYNGPTLDVKERIQNVLARMDAIEANEITDDATDSALLTLIANLSARLDERDAQIAALTTRVSTLES